jgi:protein-S-isoprenylcysteine O-methyltransferase Ste14
MTQELPRPSLLVIVPPPVWALACVGAAWAAGRALGLPVIFRSEVAGWIVFAFGFAISALGRREFAKAGTEVLPASKKNSALVASGPFARTRNPMYLGLLVAMIGLGVVIGTAAAYFAAAVFFLFADRVSIPYEEAKMEAQFGEEYRAYKARVRRWI